MNTTPTKPKLSPEVVALLQATLLRVQNVASARWWWTFLLTQEERTRLGGDFSAAYEESQIVGMWMRLYGTSRLRAICEAARRLDLIQDSVFHRLLGEIGESDGNAEQMIARAVADGGLVMIEGLRKAYWKSKKIDVDWDANPQLWQYLLELALAAKRSQLLDYMSLGRSAKPDKPTKLKYRLINDATFPLDLGDLIGVVPPGGQRLNVPPQDIRLFHLYYEDRLLELTG